MTRARIEREKRMALKIAVIEGDRMGKELAPEGIRDVEAVARLFGVNITWERLDWGCGYPPTSAA
jgi:isocitrate/isopropylmalate dehydrogenase